MKKEPIYMNELQKSFTEFLESLGYKRIDEEEVNEEEVIEEDDEE